MFATKLDETEICKLKKKRNYSKQIGQKRMDDVREREIKSALICFEKKRDRRLVR
jgi:hypothetical protein